MKKLLKNNHTLSQSTCMARNAPLKITFFIANEPSCYSREKAAHILHDIHLQHAATNFLCTEALDKEQKCSSLMPICIVVVCPIAHDKISNPFAQITNMNGLRKCPS